MRDSHRSNGFYNISNSDLKTPLIDREETELTIDTDWGPYCLIYSTIFLRDEGMDDFHHGFYSIQRRGAIRQLLAAQRILAEWDDNWRNLEVRRR